MSLNITEDENGVLTITIQYDPYGDDISESFLEDERMVDVFDEINIAIHERAHKIMDSWYEAKNGKRLDYDYIDSTEIDDGHIEMSCYTRSGCGCCPDKYEDTMRIPIEILFGDSYTKLKEIEEETQERLKKEAEEKHKRQEEAERQRKIAEEKREREQLAKLQQKYGA